MPVKVEHRIFPGMTYILPGRRVRALTSLATLATVTLLSVSLFAGCAGLFGPKLKTVSLVKSERLYLQITPLDARVVSELDRAGIDAARFAEELESEIRYRLYLRGQEEARDSAAANVIVTFTIHQLQPGSGNAGTYASYSLTGRRPRTRETETVEWTTQARSRDNVPGAFTLRHLARQAADDVLARLQPPKSNEPPPPLHLMR